MSDYPATPLILERKEIHCVNIIFGGGRALHAGFLQEVLGGSKVPVEEIPNLGDLEALERITLGQPLVLSIPNEECLNLAPPTRRKLGIWSSEPVKKRTAAIRAITRGAASIIKVTELTNAQLDLVGDQVVGQCGEEAPLQSLLWTAVWMLTDMEGLAPSEKLWKHPWDGPWVWVPRGVPLNVRLGGLYKDLGAWVYAQDDNKKGAELLGCSPSKFQYLKDVKMSRAKVESALLALSAWNLRKDTGYATALKIGAIFNG